MSTTTVFPTFDTLLASLESEDFYFDVAVASGPDAYYRRLRQHRLTLLLSDLIHSDPDYAKSAIEYATRLAKSIHGTVRSENDAALCALLIVLDGTAIAGVDDLLRYVQNSREIALHWASEVANILSATRISNTQTVIAFSDPTQSSGAEIAGWQVGITAPDQPLPEIVSSNTRK